MLPVSLGERSHTRAIRSQKRVIGSNVNVLLNRWNQFAVPITAKRPFNLSTSRSFTFKKPIQLHVILITVEDEAIGLVVTLVHLGKIRAMPQGAIEHPVKGTTLRSVIAVIPLHRSAVHLRARHRGEVPAVLQAHHGAVLPRGHVNLRTEARSLRQTPFPARRPAAVVQHARVDRLTHHRALLEARIERPVGRDVNGHGQIDQRNGTEHYDKLTEADAPADPPVLLRDHARFAFVFAAHGCIVKGTSGEARLPHRTDGGRLLVDADDGVEVAYVADRRKRCGVVFVYLVDRGSAARVVNDDKIVNCVIRALYLTRD